MDEILDTSGFFMSKFELLVSYADHIVGVATSAVSTVAARGHGKR